MTLAVDPTITLENLPQRDLDESELVALVRSVAADPARWRKHVAFSDGKRHYVSLHRDTHVDFWVLCWTPRMGRYSVGGNGMLKRKSVSYADELRPLDSPA